VAIDGRVTDELKLEGLARDVIRLVQNARKDAGLDLTDKIALHLHTEGELAKAIALHRPAIAAATQAVEWPDAAPAAVSSLTLEGQKLTLSLRKM